MVCPQEKGAEVAMASGNLETQRDESGEDEKPSPFKRAAQRQPASSLGNRPNTLQRRQSQALILNVNDFGEHAASRRSDGRRKEWWDHALSRPSTALQRLSQATKARRGGAPER